MRTLAAVRMRDGNAIRIFRKHTSIKKLTKIATIILALTYCDLVASAGLDALSEIYLNKMYWQQMVWQTADVSKLWKAEGWLPFQGKQNPRNTLTKTRKLWLLGNEVEANLGYTNGTTQNKFFATINT